MSKTSVTLLKQLKSVVRNDAQVKAIKPRQTAFHAEVPEAKGLRLKIKPNGSKLWEVVAKAPNGQTKTRGLGSFPEVRFKQAIPKALKAFNEIKEGIDARYQRQRVIRQSKAIDIAKQPIVELAKAHVEQRIQSGDVKSRSADNDYRAIRQIQAVIGHCSFMNFGLGEAKALANAYPEETAYGARDKTQKMLAKTYRGLDQSTQREIDEDIPRLLSLAYGRLTKRTRADQTIAMDQLGTFWQTLITIPCPHPLHRDALVLALLTGERKDAILGIEIKNIQIEKNQCIYIEGKTSRKTPTKNVIPLTPILGTLIERMMERAKTMNSKYLFPKLRMPSTAKQPMTKPHLTTISKDFIEALGDFGNVRPGAHNLRRTLANVGAAVLGSQDLADEHILHFNKYTSGAKWNYLDPTSEAFLETRRETFERCHQRIDDLILSGLEVLDVPLEENDEGITQSSTAITCGNTSYPLQDENGDILVNEKTNSRNRQYVYSPLASFASDDVDYVPLDNRPRCQAHIWDEMVNFGIEKPKINFRDLIR